jgi:hypothetical protein
MEYSSQVHAIKQSLLSSINNSNLDITIEETIETNFDLIYKKYEQLSLRLDERLSKLRKYKKTEK